MRISTTTAIAGALWLIACGGAHGGGSAAEQTETVSSALGTGGAPIIGLAGKCLDVDLVHKTALGNAPVILNTCNGSSTQRWQRTFGSQIENMGNSFCINAEGAGTANKTPIIMYWCGSTAQSNEKWTFEDFPNSNQLSWEIRGVGSSRCLNVPGANTSDGTALILWDCFGVSNDTWSMPTPAPIVGLAGKCLDNDASNYAVINACNGAASQDWSMNSQHQLVNSSTNSCLKVWGGATANGAPVIVVSCQSYTDETWSYVAANAGPAPSYELVEPNSGRCLNVPAANTADGTRLILWDCFGVSNDTWSSVTSFATEIKVTAFALANDDGVTHQTTVTTSDLSDGLAQVNEVFARVGVYFTLAPADFVHYNSTLLNTIDNSATAAQDSAARQIAAGNPGRLTMFLRFGSGTTVKGFSGDEFSAYTSNTDYVVLLNQGVDPSTLVHELGHYFNLSHTFPGGKYPNGPQVPPPPFTLFDSDYFAYAWWENNGQTLNLFDGDGLTDTPPDPGIDLYSRRYALAQSPPITDPSQVGNGACSGTDSLDVTQPGNGTYAFTLTPDRHDAMSYFKNCWSPYQLTFSPLQLARMRATFATGGFRTALVQQ